MIRFFIAFGISVIYFWLLHQDPWELGHYRVSAFFAWYDAWIGLYYDREKRTLYIFPIPFFGVRIERRFLTLSERNAKMKRWRKQTSAIIKARED